MKRIIRNGLLILAAGVFAVSCADYNVTDKFTAEPDPEYKEPYKDYNTVKSYLDRDKYANMSLGATLSVKEFNKQDLAHAAAVTNLDNLYFGTGLMSGTIINDKGVQNFLDMTDLLAHVDELKAQVYGSPIVANANQPDGWLKLLTAPIEIPVAYIDDKDVDYSKVDKFEGTVEAGTATIVNYDGSNVLSVKHKSRRAKVHIIEGFDVDTLLEYTVNFTARTITDKDVSFTSTFAGQRIFDADGETVKKFYVKPGKWQNISITAKAAPGVEKGYFTIEDNVAGEIYISKVSVGHYPDNHRPQTEQEKKDTINYALNTWCEGFMKINKGRIKLFDLIDEPIDVRATTEDGYYDLKHSTTSIYWQDVLGSENYAPVVANVTRNAFKKYDGKPEELKLFISESDLDNEKKLESLIHWINIWDANGANIDGINAKLSSSFSFYEDEAKQNEKKAAIDKMFENLAKTGKLIRLSNFDIKYTDINGAAVSPSTITDKQRQKLADYYAYIIKSYMTKIPADKQAGLCKGNLVDTTSDPVGLWSLNIKKDWVRNATYKAFCDALSGK